MNRTAEALTFTVLLSFEAHSLAEQYRKQHTSPQTAKQVYLNTLAVYAVDYYCRCMGLETDWETSDSHNPLMQKLMNVADLKVKQLGTLECRPVLPDAEICEVPPEAWDDRIGYVAVQLDPSLKRAMLLGFVPTVAHEQGIIRLSELRSLAQFPAYLAQCRTRVVNLGRWLEGTFEAGWQAIEELFSTREVSLALGFRGRISRFHDKTKQELIEILQSTQDEETRWQAAERLWELDPNNSESGVRRIANLGMQLAGYAVALMVAILPKPDRSIAILLRVYPMGNQSHLPPSLQLIILDEAGNVFSEVQARREDDYIQYKFSADPGDCFSVRVALDEASITESFMV